MNTMRLGDGGFISTVDTVVALEALVIYSYNSRIKDITNLNVIVDVPDSNVTKDFHITGNSGIAKTQRLDIREGKSQGRQLELHTEGYGALDHST